MRFFRRRPPNLPDFVEAYLDAPSPHKDTPWRAVPYTVLDVETSGLDARRDALLAVGLVDIDDGRVRIDRCWKTLIRPPDSLVVPAESIRIHQILRGDVAEATPPADVLPALLQRLQGRVLIVHVSAIDVEFLSRALRQQYGVALRGPAIDTARLALALQIDDQFLGGSGVPEEPAIALRGLAEAARLPVYPEHDALNDALTTAQLFLVQATRLEGRGVKTLKGLLKKGGCL